MNRELFGELAGWIEAGHNPFDIRHNGFEDVNIDMRPVCRTPACIAGSLLLMDQANGRWMPSFLRACYNIESEDGARRAMRDAGEWYVRWQDLRRYAEKRLGLEHGDAALLFVPTADEAGADPVSAERAPERLAEHLRRAQEIPHISRERAVRQLRHIAENGAVDWAATP